MATDERSRAHERVDEPPTANQQVDNTTTDIANPHAMCAEPTKPVDASYNSRDPPLEKRAGDEIEGGEKADEEHRVYAKLIDERTSRAVTSEDDTTTTIASAPPSMSLEGEHIGQSSDSSTGLTVRETDQPTRANASA